MPDVSMSRCCCHPLVEVRQVQKVEESSKFSQIDAAKYFYKKTFSNKDFRVCLLNLNG